MMHLKLLSKLPVYRSFASLAAKNLKPDATENITFAVSDKIKAVLSDEETKQKPVNKKVLGNRTSKTLRRPPSGYNLYLRDRIKDYSSSSKTPLTRDEVRGLFSTFSKDYKLIEPEEKEKYQQMHNELFEEYRKKKEEVKDATRKRPLSGYQFFAQQYLRNYASDVRKKDQIRQGMMGTAIQELAQKWKNLSLTEKENYGELAQKRWSQSS
uniref:HMG box domain-containing protein n=1 Tax=Polytomella parva TaxID=51329 RepID=A0A7S0YAV0_9CHLO|mmetsp:Transcript_14208/g.24847  ORF Transcript_14208/g.24847 Transcript_14208/m.24847 type:complete len:211 (+) Transcript_14208:123-755(+)|eukprot:CAMPEP_0175078744 /NCGR_PEP_ID=MMETSP0052_2-20121109/24338_1 /TAXON_ID=51329 ORGANISM="Polytomella parva, Strain SAG 63-3" /NCGR_SAMPLE_ID=MMETSP0052_2 /ASSEMBLY_ACC=CAM_ASM_000194 /LENGTH=210 /DNA_ID=CAMNT_0016348799 /DNA_START=121 /DNA_END=753 /DNA_ORIENTATION=-